jgi:thiol-disulfide isomerase/thioredoxin
MRARQPRPSARAGAFALGFAIALGAVGASVGRPASAAPTLAPITGYADWIAARPAASDLHGKVVIVDIFTFGCYNCQNITPNLRALYRDRRRDGLEIVGVHTPETPYETERPNVVANLAKQGIVWPVAVDNDHKLWNAYDTEYWPTQLIFDRHGVLRKTIVGDSQDDAVNATVARLLAEK